VSARRRVRIDFDLPELTPAQADLLWNFLEELAMDLWEAYETELLEVENQPDWTAAQCDEIIEDTTLTPGASADADF
jgi:hypothetical protein